MAAVVGLVASLAVTYPAIAQPPESSTTDPVHTALAEADRKQAPVEVPSLHTENSTTVANPGGRTLSTTVHAHPVRFTAADGWRAIDLTLVESGGAVRPRSARDDVRLSAGGDTVLLSVRDADGKGTTDLAAPAVLPKPVLDGSTATYPAAYGPDIDLVVDVTPAGIRHRIVVHRRPDRPVSFRLPVATGNGISYRAREVLDDGAKVADLTPPVLLDADKSAGDVAVAVDDQGTELTYTPDAAFLADTATTYPVTIAGNPTPWFGPGFPTDVFVATDSRYATARSTQYRQEILAGRHNWDGAVSTYYLYRSYLKFNLDSAPFYGRPILNADMRPWNYITSQCGSAAGDIVVRRVTGNWALDANSPVDLRWNNQPSVTTAGQGVKAGGVGRVLKRDGSYQYCSQPAQELYYSIEGVVQAWADGAPNYGLQVAALNESSGPSNFREYLSSEWNGVDGRGPVLFVEYEAPEPKKAVPFYIPGPETDPAPTEQEMADHSDGHDEAPYVPVLTEEQALPLRQNADQAVKHDSGYGFYPPDDATREQWVDDLDLPAAGWEPEPDTTPPAVAWTDPSAGQTDVPLAATVTAVFDEPVTDATLVVKDPGGAAVGGTVSTGESTVTLAPSARLTPATAYTAEVGGAVDGSGNAMAAPHAWTFTTGTADPTPEGLVAAYGMEEGSGDVVADRSGNGNTGTATGLTRRAGRFGEALAFDGLDGSMVTVPDSPSLRLSTGMTVSAWVLPEAVDDWSTVLMKDHQLGSAYGLYASNGDVPSVWLADDADHTILDGPSPLPTDEWSHLAVTYDGAVVRLLLDGVEVASAPRTTPLDTASGELHIGGNGSWGEFFRGAIDEVRIYDRAQTPEQVQADMDTPVDPSAAPMRAAAAPTPHPYGHINHDACRTRAPGDNSVRRYVNSNFSVCYSGRVGENMLNAQDAPTGEWWRSYISITVHSYVGDASGNARGLPGATSRQIKVSISFKGYDHRNWVTGIHRPVVVKLNPTANCTADFPDGISQSAYSWIHGGERTIMLTSKSTALPEYREICAIKPSILYPESEGKRHNWLDDDRLDFRCDSVSLKDYKGGCVVWSVRPVFVLDGNANDGKAKKTAEHIWTALHDPQNTDPKAPSGQTKRIPGLVDLSDPGCAGAKGCLTRTTSNRKTTGSVAYKNYQRARDECELLSKAGVNKPSCDEFPFASTHEGGASAGIHFSVKIVPLGDNCSGGAHMTSWYRTNRILEKDPFWVDAIKQGQPVPPDVILPTVTPDALEECDLL
ncbi:LamG-like jellyroll fold domain-containing protein [Actinosynnema sp. NPDC002837]